jgi:general L-amino acid transport system permease protein
LQLFFWYKAVLAVLPGPRQGFVLPFGTYLNNRGLFVAKPVFEPGFGATALAVVAAVAAAVAVTVWARRRKMQTGQDFPTLWVALAILIGLPLVVFVASGSPLSFKRGRAFRLQLRGGLNVKPEFLALELGLVLYTASYIAEIVRAGILAVSHGQTEAALSLGLRSSLTRRLVVLPQALRVIIPPLTNQFLNLTKNSSLAVAIGYPDLVSVFAGTVLNQTGQAVEAIFITMIVYLVLSLLTSAFMNWFNARVALVER